MHIFWPSAIIAIVLLFLGIASISTRRWIAKFAAYRQSRYYGEAARIFAFQTSPRYYVVIGIVLVMIGVFVALGALHR